MAYEEDEGIIWPCLRCGASQADGFDTNDKLKVIKCTNCGLIENDEHIESELCWCEPRLIYLDEDSGEEVWLHNQKH